MSEPLIDPDCRDPHKHATCAGGPCQCPCHMSDDTGDRLIDVPKGWDSWPFGPSGIALRRGNHSVIVSDAQAEGVEWRHASIARQDQMPTYRDLVFLHSLAFGQGYAYQCFVPHAEHVNIHEQCLHLWGRVDGVRVLPDFTRGGVSI